MSNSKALTLEEIKQDIQKDLTAIASFNKTHPLDFKLYEGEDKEPVIFIENGTKGQELNLEISNNSDQQISFPSLSGEAKATNHHFELRFRSGTLSPTSLQQLALAEQENWKMSSSVTQDDGTVSFYFLADRPTINAKQNVSFTLQNVNGAAAGGSRSTRVELRIPQFSDRDETFHHYFREKQLNIINHRGKKHIPLHVGFVGSNRILNDGKTGNDLTLRITNVLKNEAIPLNPTSKDDEASKFIISCDVQNQGEQKEWALLEAGQVAGVSVKYEGEEITNSAQEGESPEWIITFDSETAIEAGQHHQLQLSDIISSLPSGHANLYVRYENIPGYWDGTFVCTIKKTPIVYDDKGNIAIAGKLSVSDTSILNGDTAIAGKLSVTETSTLTGKVGIGIDPGIEQLKVEGDAAIAGNLSVNDGRIGIGSSDFSKEPLVIRAQQRQEGLIAFEDPDRNKKWHIEQNFGGNTPGLNFVETEVADFRLFIQEGGNVGIGTKNPLAKLHVNGLLKVDGHLGVDGHLSVDEYLIVDEYLRVKKQNDWCIKIENNPNSTYKVGMKLTDEGYFEVTNQTDGGTPARLDSNGNWKKGSDVQLKTNIEPIPGLLDKVLALDPVSFHYKTQDSSDDTDKSIGFIAQEVEPIFPNLVSGQDIKYLDYTSMITAAISAIQEQQKLISKLAEEVADLRIKSSQEGNK